VNGCETAQCCSAGAGKVIPEMFSVVFKGASGNNRVLGEKKLMPSLNVQI